MPHSPTDTLCTSMTTRSPNIRGGNIDPCVHPWACGSVGPEPRLGVGFRSEPPRTWGERQLLGRERPTRDERNCAAREPERKPNRATRMTTEEPRRHLRQRAPGRGGLRKESPGWGGVAVELGAGPRLHGEAQTAPGAPPAASPNRRGRAACSVCHGRETAGNGFVSKCFMGKFHLEGLNLD